MTSSLLPIAQPVSKDLAFIQEYLGRERLITREDVAEYCHERECFQLSVDTQMVQPKKYTLETLERAARNNQNGTGDTYLVFLAGTALAMFDRIRISLDSSLPPSMSRALRSQFSGVRQPQYHLINFKHTDSRQSWATLHTNLTSVEIIEAGVMRRIRSTHPFTHCGELLGEKQRMMITDDTRGIHVFSGYQRMVPRAPESYPVCMAYTPDPAS